MLQEFLVQLKKQLTSELPGVEAHRKMASYLRITAEQALNRKKNVRLSAVLLLLYAKKESIHTLLIQRPTYKGVHSAQMAFPGGRKEPEDKNLQQTALRETEEELGISRNKINIVGQMTKVYIPPSRYIVAPYIGYMDEPPTLIPDPKEVAEVVSVSLNELLAPETIKKAKVAVGKYKMKLKVPCFDVQQRIVWGATAMMISEFRDIVYHNDLIYKNLDIC
ncbi:CoA pyrophosphatase [Candidatus Uabimicrobium sp. HlEnr_7]|uniref:NUDIX hydrolase n=1 Tax=Candidatus Uabimicrobium helgolandensis TaxID=3095367 RepID=UPI0035569CDE